MADTRRTAKVKPATGRATTSSTKKTGRAETGSTRRPPAPKQDTTLIVGGAVGGGALLLVIIIAVASSGGRPPAPPPREVKAPPPVERPVESHRTVSETGAIMFICGGSTKHEDKEVILSQCPGCGAYDKFYWKESQYLCLTCSKAFDNAKIACRECGKVPRVHRIKHR